MLRASYGEGLDLQDELDYFPDPEPKDWLCVTDSAGLPRGFLRYFPVSGSLFAAEFFVPLSVNRSQQLEALLNTFAKCHTLPEGAVLRVDASAGDTEMETALRRFARINEVREFQHFERRVQGSGQPLEREALSDRQLRETQAVLSKLNTCELERLQELWKARQLFSLEVEGQVVAAAHLQPKSSHVLDIAAFATAEEKRGQGFGTRLLNTVLERFERAIDTVELKVRSNNEAAIRLYKRCGFTPVPSRDETWWYTTWDETPTP